MAQLYAGIRLPLEPGRGTDANVGLWFWVYVTTVPLTLLTLASLVGALNARQPVRTWWLAAVLAALQAFALMNRYRAG